MNRPNYRVRTGLTLALGATLAMWTLMSAWRAARGDISLLTHLVASCPALYFLCICVHDGVHGVLARPRWVNQAGASALSLVIGLPFPLLQEAHLRHHRRMGHPDDPEYVVYSAQWWQLPGRLVLVPWYYLRGIVRLDRARQVQTVAQLALTAVVLAWGGAVLWQVWALPVLLAIVWFGFTTVYVPHCPYADRLMPWFQTHSGWHHDHHFDVRYPWPQYAQIRAWRFDHGLTPESASEERWVRWCARELHVPTAPVPDALPGSR